MNVPTIIALCVLGAVTVAILATMIINRKKGKGGCSCGCGGCANKDFCHPPKTDSL